MSIINAHTIIISLTQKKRKKKRRNDKYVVYMHASFEKTSGKNNSFPTRLVFNFFHLGRVIQDSKNVRQQY